MKLDFDLVNYEKFVTQYMKINDDSFILKKNLIRIHRLSTTASLVKVPTPLLRTEYNFLLFFTHGGATQQVDNTIIELKANDLLFIREGHLNAIKSLNPNSKGYFIYINSTLLPQLFTNKTSLSTFTFSPKRTISKIDMEWVCKCIDLTSQIEHINNDSLEIQISLLKAIISKLTNSSKSNGTKPDRQTEISMLFKELVYKNFKEKREISFYAKSLSITENYLNRCVKKLTNKPPKQHINEVVIYHSQILLQDLAKDISQVAFELNFHDPSYFGRLFKQITGQSPSMYRESILQDLS